LNASVVIVEVIHSCWPAVTSHSIILTPLIVSTSTDIPEGAQLFSLCNETKWEQIGDCECVVPVLIIISFVFGADDAGARYTEILVS